MKRKSPQSQLCLGVNKGQEEERSVYRSRAWMEVPLYGQKILGFE